MHGTHACKVGLLHHATLAYAVFENICIPVYQAADCDMVGIASPAL
jgi:hypothetical protein